MKKNMITIIAASTVALVGGTLVFLKLISKGKEKAELNFDFDD